MSVSGPGLTRSKAIKLARNFLFGVPAFACFSYMNLSNSYFLEEYRKRFQLHDEFGKSKKVNEQVGLTCLGAIEDTKIVIKKKLKTKFFHVIGTDIFSAGSYDMRNGVVIGIPYNFTYNSVSDVIKEYINIGKNRTIDWGSEYTEQLLQSLILSENAKKFAISREMYFCNNNRIIFVSIVAAISCILPPYASDFYQKFRNNPFKKSRMTFLLYAFTIPFSIMQYLFIEGKIYNYYDLLADKKAACLSEHYCDGAIEYYEKKMLFNKACSKLIGEEFFTKDGDVETRKYRVKLKEKLNVIKQLKPDGKFVNKPSSNE